MMEKMYNDVAKCKHPSLQPYMISSVYSTFDYIPTLPHMVTTCSIEGDHVETLDG